MVKACAGCGREWEPKRPHAKYCGDTCRKRGQRGSAVAEAAAGGSSVLSVAPVQVVGELSAATRRMLEAAGRVESELGAAALLLARRADRVGLVETGSGLAALMREWDSMLTKAVAGAEQSDDVVARIQESAALKLLRGGRRGA
jgi:hypothetical protein